MTEFKDTHIIMHELEQLFNRDDDIKDILDIKKMQHEIEVQCNAHLKDTKEVIRGKIIISIFYCVSITRFKLYYSFGGASC